MEDQRFDELDYQNVIQGFDFGQREPDGVCQDDVLSKERRSML